MVWSNVWIEEEVMRLLASPDGQEALCQNLENTGALHLTVAEAQKVGQHLQLESPRDC